MIFPFQFQHCVYLKLQRRYILYKTMNTQAKNIHLSESKKDFFERRSTQLKRKYPMMTQAQIQKKVQEQWSTNNKKSQMKGINTQANDQNVNVQANQSDVARKLEFGDKKDKKMESEQQQQARSQSQLDSSMKSQIERQSTEMKSKKIRKVLSNEYKKFWSFYHTQLKSEHPKWTNNQRNKIISLLWRKKKLAHKQHRNEDIIKRFKVVTGRAKFVGDKTNPQYSAELWRALPKESKQYWKKIGANPNKDPFDKSRSNFEILRFSNNEKMIKNSPSKSQTSDQLPINFMNKLI